MRRWRPVNSGRALRVTVLVLALAAVTLLGYFGGIYMEKRTYRLDYPGEIEHFAEEFGLDGYLVAAVIHCESGNRPEAVSSQGAVGLMQIMPSTGEWIAEKLNVSDYTEKMLTEPETNIKFGCWYLAFLLERYGGDLTHVLAAYNAGPGNLDNWLENSEYSTDGVLNSIPFLETEKYVDKVQRAYDKYQRLYKNSLG